MSCKWFVGMKLILNVLELVPLVEHLPSIFGRVSATLLFESFATHTLRAAECWYTRKSMRKYASTTRKEDVGIGGHVNAKR